MSQDFYSKAADLTSQRRSFAVATVVRVEGSSSARRGSKAMIGADGLESTRSNPGRWGYFLPSPSATGTTLYRLPFTKPDAGLRGLYPYPHTRPSGSSGFAVLIASLWPPSDN